MIISVALQKGGVGKTTTVVNTATILAEHGHKVLVVDMDAQANATMSFGLVPEDYIGASIVDVLQGDMRAREAILKTDYNVDIIPSNIYLSGVVITVISNNIENPMHLLSDQLELIRDNYDYILIDTPPELGFYTINSLTASDYVIIAMQCEARAARGVDIVLDTVRNVQQAYNPNLKVMGVLPTIFNRNTNISTTVLQEARRYLGELGIKVYDTTIYRTVRFSEADLHNAPAVTFTDNEQVQNYREFVREAFNVG